MTQAYSDNVMYVVVHLYPWFKSVSVIYNGYFTELIKKVSTDFLSYVAKYQVCYFNQALQNSLNLTIHCFCVLNSNYTKNINTRPGLLRL